MLEWDDNLLFLFPDSVPDRLVSDKVDLALTRDKPVQEIVPSEKRAMEEKRRIVRSPQHMPDTSIDDIGIPLRVRQRWTSDHCKNRGQILPVLRLKKFPKAAGAAKIADVILVPAYLITSFVINNMFQLYQVKKNEYDHLFSSYLRILFIHC